MVELLCNIDNVEGFNTNDAYLPMNYTSWIFYFFFFYRTKHEGLLNPGVQAIVPLCPMITVQPCTTDKHSRFSWGLRIAWNPWPAGCTWAATRPKGRAVSGTRGRWAGRPTGRRRTADVLWIPRVSSAGPILRPWRPAVLCPPSASRSKTNTVSLTL